MKIILRILLCKKYIIKYLLLYWIIIKLKLLFKTDSFDSQWFNYVKQKIYKQFKYKIFTKSKIYIICCH